MLPRNASLPRHLLVVILTGLILLPACSVKVGTGAADDSTSSTDHTSQSGIDSTVSSDSNDTGVAPALKWKRCRGNFECAKLEVPIDYAHPDDGTLELALLRRRSIDREQRIGSLVVNPGGPGGSGIALAQAMMPDRDIRKSFDIVGFDPRGVGESTPIECHDNLEQMYSADPAPRTPEATQHLLNVSKTFVDACAAKYEKLLPHLGTRDVARDLDRIRAALGDEKLTYLGYSYGTSIGQVYADMFPKNVRAMVLDGVVRLGESGLDAATSQALAFEGALTAFINDCKADSGCKLGDDPGAMIDQVLARVRRQPIPSTGGSRPLGPGEFQLGVGQALYAKPLWRQLQNAIWNAAVNNDGTGLVSLADMYLQRNLDGTYPNTFEVYFAVSCLDWDWPHDPRKILEAGRKVAAKAPRLGEGIVTDYVRCAMWPTPPQPLTPPKAIGSPTILIVSTTGDPATPYQNGVDLAHALPHGALVTFVGEGHTAYGNLNSCVDDAVNTYLLTTEAPADTRCS